MSEKHLDTRLNVPAQDAIDAREQYEEALTQGQRDYAAHDAWWRAINGDAFFDLTTRNQSAAAYAKGREHERAALASRDAAPPAAIPAAPSEDVREAERSSFDAWAASEGDTTLQDRSDAWRAWKARAMLATAVPDEITPEQEGNEDYRLGWNDCRTAALAQPAPVQPLIDWVVERWHAEVKNRPMVNIHRRSLDDTWRQVLRHLGVDDRARLGPTHDELRAEIGSKEWEAMNGKAAPVQQEAATIENFLMVRDAFARIDADMENIENKRTKDYKNADLDSYGTYQAATIHHAAIAARRCRRIIRESMEHLAALQPTQGAKGGA